LSGRVPATAEEQVVVLAATLEGFAAHLDEATALLR
jgi:hypothetical protein